MAKFAASADLTASRYQILCKLAVGGMAEIFLARAVSVAGAERYCVLKRILRDRARDVEFVQMFLDEARLAASLHHQNIIQVHDIGEADGEYFFAMEYVHGEDLRSLLLAHAKQRAHMPLPFVISIVAAAAAGLHHAHERKGTDKRPLNIVHRDVSPSNILVGYDGSIKLLDFGIAKAGAGEDTLAGHLKGKLSYMSPEQIQSGSVDRRSDVYSLGVVLYELATTTRLFRGDTDALVTDQILKGRVSLPRVRRPDLSNELSLIIMKAIDPDPERRYQSADELRAALDDYSELNGMDVKAAQIASYMRKLFGDKPEPWLDLSSRASEAVEELMPTSISMRPTWNEGSKPTGSRPFMHARGTTANGSEAPNPPSTGTFSAVAAPSMNTDRVPKVHAQLDSVGASAVWKEPPLESPAKARTKLILLGAAIAAVFAAILLVVATRGNGEDKAVEVAQVGSAPQPAQAHPTVSPITETPAPAAAATPVKPTQVAKTEPATVKKPAPQQQQQQQQQAARTIAKKQDDTVAARLSTIATVEKPQAAKDTKSDKVAAAVETKSEPAKVDDKAAKATDKAQPATSPSLVAGSTTSTTTPAAPTAPPAPPPVVPTQIPTLDHGTVERVAALHGKELTKCEAGDVRGEIVVRFVVDSLGHLQRPQIATHIKNPKFAACILRSMARWQFPKQGVDGAQGIYTMSFQ